MVKKQKKPSKKKSLKITIPGEDELNDQIRLFYDEFYKQYFESTYFKVQRVEYEWYEALDIDVVENGYALGWSTFQCMEMYCQPWIDFDHYKFTTEDGRECTEICMVEQPVLDF